MFGLSDAISMLRAYTDQTHKFWGYYQAVTIATVGYAWAASALPEHILATLSWAYPTFVLLNHRLVFESQTAARTVWDSIQTYKHASGHLITPEFRENLTLSRPTEPSAVAVMHVLIGSAGTLAILERFWRSGAA
jgi:hypothetical protein